MSMFHTIAAGIVIVGLALTAVAALIRIVRGPTILDRMVASDVLLTTLMLAVGSHMALTGRTENIPVMVSIAATAVLATIVVARYVRRRAVTASSVASPSNETKHTGNTGRGSGAENA